jgi:hypothetical protein
MLTRFGITHICRVYNLFILGAEKLASEHKYLISQQTINYCKYEFYDAMCRAKRAHLYEQQLFKKNAL